MHRALRAALLGLARRDQRARRNAARPFVAVDKLNTNELKRIVASFGWPTITRVGREAATAAWLIAQHTDHDPAFQAECLRLLRREARRGEADRVHVAYLTDRVLVNQGRRQLYGTQFFLNRNGRLKPRPIRNVRGLNARRRRFGLGAFDEYAKRLAAQQRLLDRTKRRPMKAA